MLTTLLRFPAGNKVWREINLNVIRTKKVHGGKPNVVHNICRTSGGLSQNYLDLANNLADLWPSKLSNPLTKT